jgi:adenylate kinase family enzyme
MKNTIFGMQNRILIIGNSGSGKSWLSGTLSLYLGIDQTSLDNMNWEPGGFFKEKDEFLVQAELEELSRKSSWIIEGVYGNLAEIVLPRATHFFWLDLDSEFCVASVKSRGFDHIEMLDSEVKIDGYLNHVKSYFTNSGPMSRDFHKFLFQKQISNKLKFTTRDEVNEFINGLKV